MKMRRWFSIILMLGIAITMIGCKSSDKEISNNQVEHVILYQNADIDLDNKNDEIYLYFKESDSSIYLAINNIELRVESDVDKEQIIGEVLSEKYISKLYIEGNILTVCLSKLANKWGTKSLIYCYKYQNDNIECIWSSEELVDKSMAIEGLDLNKNILKVNMFDSSRDLVMSDEDEEALVNLLGKLSIKVKEYNLDTVIVPAYGYYDFDKDDNNELVIELLVWSGAGPIFDKYYMVYDLTSGNVVLEDSWFRSKRPNLSNSIQLEEIF